MTAFFLAVSDAEELSGSVTDPALLQSSSSRNARLRADEELQVLRPGLTRHQSHRPGHRAFDVQPDSIRVPPLAHDEGDERGGQSSLP